MNPRTSSFWRKIIYLAVIGVLLIPLFFLGSPATSDTEKAPGSLGGVLARLRAEHGLSQAHLGEIDPTSETMKLATLGMRGVAANILWGKAHVYKKKKDWTNLAATVRQITKLQPNFIQVWVFQGWNLAYNVSAEFDDYRERYRWVIKGIHFLEEGMDYNQREPRLQWEAGWFLSQKIGRADESKQFRRLFKLDDDFHSALPFEVPVEVPGDDPRDNWLVGKVWFTRATDLVDNQGATMKGKPPVLYYSNAPMCRMNYADALENDGIFGDRARYAWRKAAEEWEDYGWRGIATSYTTTYGEPIIIQLNDLDIGKDFQGRAEELAKELDALEPGLREKIKKEKRAGLTEEQRKALDTPPAERTGKQQALADDAKEKVEVTYKDILAGIKGAKRPEAGKLYRELTIAENMATIIRRSREIVNFDYWRDRANVEQTDEAVAAREFIYRGDQHLDKAELDPAKENFKSGLAQWRKVLDKREFSHLVSDETFGSDMLEVIERYRRLLDLRDEKEERDLTYGKDLLLFSVASEFQGELDGGVISADLRLEFKNHEVLLSDGASVSTEEEGSRWLITDQTAMYKVVKEANTLNILKHFILSDIIQLHEEGG